MDGETNNLRCVVLGMQMSRLCTRLLLDCTSGSIEDI
jgi:hypothetical protein